MCSSPTPPFLLGPVSEKQPDENQCRFIEVMFGMIMQHRRGHSGVQGNLLPRVLWLFVFSVSLVAKPRGKRQPEMDSNLMISKFSTTTRFTNVGEFLYFSMITLTSEQYARHILVETTPISLLHLCFHSCEPILSPTAFSPTLTDVVIFSENHFFATATVTSLNCLHFALFYSRMTVVANFLR